MVTTRQLLMIGLGLTLANFGVVPFSTVTGERAFERSFFQWCALAAVRLLMYLN